MLTFNLVNMDSKETRADAEQCVENPPESIANLQLSLKEKWDEKERVPILCDLVMYFDGRYVESRDIAYRRLATLYAYEILTLISSEDGRRLNYVLSLLGMLVSIVEAMPTDLQDIEDGLTIGEEALELVGPSHELGAQMKVLLWLNNLHAARYRFRIAEDDCVKDLNQAIVFAEIAVRRQPTDARAVFTVVQSLLKRYERYGDYEDAELAVRFAEGAYSRGLDNYQVLGQLCSALQARYLATKTHGDLDEAIHRLEQLNRRTNIPDGVREDFRSQLEILQDLHSERVDDLDAMTDQDLDTSISNATKELVELSLGEGNTALRHILRRAKCSGLKALHTRSLEDLEMASQYLMEAYMLLPNGDIRNDGLLLHQAAIWKAKGDALEDEQERMRYYQLAREIHLSCLERKNRSPLDCIQSHHGLADLLLVASEFSTAAYHLQQAMDLMPLVARQYLSIDDLEYVLKQVSGLSSLTAATMLTAGTACPHSALAAMELGRGVIYGLITSTRADISGLKQSNPELHAEYAGLRSGISGATGKMTVMPFPDILRAVKRAGFEVPELNAGNWAMDSHDGITEVPGLPGTILVSHNPQSNELASSNTQALNSRAESDRRKQPSMVLDTTNLPQVSDDSNIPSNLRISRSENGTINIDILNGSEDGVVLEDYQPGLATSIRAEHAAQLARVQERIRITNNIDHLQERSSLDYFQTLGKAGPIVSFNITPSRSDAFIVTEEGVRLITFESKTLSYAIVNKKAEMLFGPKSLLVEREDLTQKQRNKRLRELLMWLWEAAVKPALGVLELLREQPVKDFSTLPRLWWVTSGILGQFPLHAAGSKWGESMENTMSHVVSSYVPALRTLEYSRAKTIKDAPSHESQSLILAMRETVGKPSLDIDEEVALVAELTSTKPLDCPSRASVLQHLRNSDIVHFACHSEADPRHPRKSTFYVAESKDGLPGTVTVEDLARVDAPNTQLAYLSACSTAEQKENRLVEESLHLAGAFLMIGFPQVVGTLWETKNWAATKVASKFYRLLGDEMKNNGGSVSQHSGKFAVFLHQAIVETRTEGNGGGINNNARDNILAWAPFVHFGC
jgi:hypothetical protein